VTSSSSGEPARFVHSREDAARTFGALRAFYWLIAALLLGVGLVASRALVIPALVFMVVLLAWQRQIRRAAAESEEWVLEITADTITVGDRSVARTDASAVRFHRRHTRVGSWTALQVLGPEGQSLLREGLRADHVDGVAAALRERGWPVED